MRGTKLRSHKLPEGWMSVQEAAKRLNIKYTSYQIIVKRYGAPLPEKTKWGGWRRFINKEKFEDWLLSVPDIIAARNTADDIL